MPIELIHITRLSNDSPKRPLLNQLSFSVPDRSITLILGQTGSGKSTLLRLLSGLMQADAGEIRYDQTPLWSKQKIKRSLLARLGMTFQYPEHQLFAASVKAEFLYSLKPLKLGRQETNRRIQNAMHAMDLPESLLEESPFSLSSGLKRRTAIATTISTEPDWLFLDEPTAGVDPYASNRLIEYLKRRSETNASGGTVVATHDLDLFLPIANWIVLLKEGELFDSFPAEQVTHKTDSLLQAGIGLPASLHLSKLLVKAGLPEPPRPLEPEDMAASIIDSIHQVPANRVIPQHAENLFEKLYDSHAENLFEKPYDPNERNASAEKGPVSYQSEINTLPDTDPRAKWLVYLMISIGVLIQHRLSGYLIASAVTAFYLLASRIPFQRLATVLKPYLILMAFAGGLAGFVINTLSFDSLIKGEGISFSFFNCIQTLLPLYKILLVLFLGVWFQAGISHLKVKHAVETSFRGLKRFHLPVEAFALATTLLFRFLPLIFQELERFADIAKARAKSTAKTNSLRLRDFKSVMIPFLLAILRLGEDLAIAMEARGYRRFDQLRTSSIHLQLTRHDFRMILIGLLLFLTLILVSY